MWHLLVLLSVYVKAMSNDRTEEASSDDEPIVDVASEDYDRGVDVNRVVSYNLRVAREQNGWTQSQFADRLEQVTGTRPAQANVSALERVWEGGRRREFDAQKLVDFAVALNVPIIWFFLPPPGEHREIQNTGRHMTGLIELLLGRNDQVHRVEERLREIGMKDPTAAQKTAEMLTGWTTGMGADIYRARRTKMLALILAQLGDELDEAAELWGYFWDRVRATGVRGLIAEKTHDPTSSHGQSDTDSLADSPSATVVSDHAEKRDDSTPTDTEESSPDALNT